MTASRSSVVIACTFRSFNGGPNDSIQKNFLDCLSQQTIPVRLVVTQWGEIGVREALTESGIAFELVEKARGKWSHTEVLRNAVMYSSSSAIMWTTSDITFADNFIETFITNPKIDSGFATSWPHYSINSESELRIRPYSELDFVFLSSKIASQVSNLLDATPNIGWGLFENQLTWACKKISGKRGLNLIRKVRAIKTDNPRVELSELPETLRLDWLANKERWLGSLPGLKQIWLLTSWSVLRYSGTPHKFKVIATKDLLRDVIAKLKL